MNQEHVEQDLSTSSDHSYYAYTFLKLTSPLSVHFLQSRWSQYDESHFFSSSDLQSIPSRPLFLVLLGTATWALCVCSIALSCKSDIIIFFVPSVLFLELSDHYSPLSKEHCASRNLQGIKAVEVTEVHKQTKLYWRILTKIKRKTYDSFYVAGISFSQTQPVHHVSLSLCYLRPTPLSLQ